MGPTLCGTVWGGQHFSDWLADINKSWRTRRTHVPLGVYNLLPVMIIISHFLYSFTLSLQLQFY